MKATNTNKSKRMAARIMAERIHTNCRAYHDGTVGYDEWHAEHHRLWRIADRCGISPDVQRIIHDVGSNY